jgi:murein DD-endopeptidase MepM/ murein hydrolase activator NlpD
VSKIKYKYNPESLSYEKVVLTFWQKVVKALPFVGLAIVFSVLVSILAFTFFKSPREKAYLREIKQLKTQFSQLSNEFKNTEKILASIEQRDNKLYRVILEANAYPENKRKLAIGGSDKYKDLQGFDNSELIIATTRQLDEIQKSIYAQSKSFDELVELAKRKDKMLKSIPAVIPVPNREVTAHTGAYGWRIDPIYRTRAFHSGMDFPCKTGTKIRATGDAIVENVENGFWGYGNIVLLNHGFGYKTMYAHLSEFNVKKGQKVNRGDVIGFAGSTGKSTAPHLHYEVIKNGEKINPINFYFNDLTPAQYEEMIKASQESGTSFD